MKYLQKLLNKQDQHYQIYSIIFNKSIKEGIFPDALKVSKILPLLHKSDSVFDVSNYRPIPLLPIISKIFEKLIFVRLNEFITNTPNTLPKPIWISKK